MTFPDTTFTQGTTITSTWLNAVNDYCNESNPADHSSANVEYDPPFTGGVATTVQDKLAQTVSVKDFGAVGDGVTDDTQAIQNAISASFEKQLLFPNGTYLTDSISLTSVDGVYIVGESRYSTTIKLNDNQDNHLISFITSTNCVISNITLDQNRLNNTAGHGVRLGGIDNITIENVTIKSCANYGIGAQAGTNKNVLITNFEITDIFSDAIDIKDFNFDNSDIIITNGIISNYGLSGNVHSGCDVRGPAVVSNLQIKAQNALNRGFRLREGNTQGRYGYGTFNNILIDGNNVGLVGITVEGSATTNYTISNVSVLNCGFLGIISGTNGLINNVSILGAFGDSPLSIFSTNTIFNNVNIAGGTDRNIDFEPGASGNILSNFFISGVTPATQAIRLQTTADNNTICDGSIESGDTISDSGLNTVIRNVRNWKTSVNVLSAPFAVDSTGTKIQTISLGLAVTPKPEDISISVVIPSGGAVDWRYDLLAFNEPSSGSSLTIRCVVDTASATVGATAYMAVSVNSRIS